MIKTYAVTNTKPADRYTKAFRFVLHDRFGDPSTHMETFDKEGKSDGFHHGHYFNEKDLVNGTALKDLRKRADQEGLVIQDPEALEPSDLEKGWPGDGSGLDDLADFNQMEAADYANE